MDTVIGVGGLALLVLLVGALLYNLGLDIFRSPERRWTVLGPLAAVAVVLFLFSRSGSHMAPGSGTACESTACMVASLDAAGYVAPDDPVVGQYQAALDSLVLKCSNPETTIGDFAVKAQELLANGGVTETLLSILRHVDDSIPTVTPVTDCADIFAAYVTLRGGQP